ncbi:ABC transporter substrate-binding protein [Streptomyces phaeochromogenes]|uniref:ABC transporter substrate-binding protein n=1 Tax=Streptomyces phaeochromogenes TaxID=1923 RepID=UPI002DDB3743|nr:ABC transporter substrate-binding protein [Streptomyces phaeochromogenes]WRZ34578.1 ABC transporter substrate-binding protein [Streptomyces phaeochromogenes]
MMDVTPKSRPPRVTKRLRAMGTASTCVLAAIATASACTAGTQQNESGGETNSTLTMSIGAAPTGLALATNCSSPLFSLTYASLISIKPDGSYGPGLATSWQYSKNNTVFTMKIRPKVKFADGTPLTAANVVQTLTYNKTHPGINQGYLKPFTSIEAPDASTVRITMQKPFNGMTTLLANDGECNNGLIISKAGLAAPSKMGTQTFGAGAYKLDPAATVAGDHYALVQNPNYYDKSQQHWSRIVIKVIPNANTALQAVKTGQVQVASTTDGTLLGAAKAGGLQITEGLQLGTGLMLWDRDGKLAPALKDQRVRQALNYAVDRPALAKVLGTTYQPFDQFVPAGVTGYDPSLDNKYNYDPAKAKRLLAQAGYPTGFRMTIGTDNSVGNFTQAVVQQWAKIGVKVTVDTITNGTFLSKVAAKTYPAGSTAVALLGDTYFDAARLLAPPYNTAWDPFKATDPDIDKAYEALAAAPQDQITPLSRELNRVVTEKAWFVPVAHAPAYLFSKGVAGMGKAAIIGGFDYLSWKPAS